MPPRSLCVALAFVACGDGSDPAASYGCPAGTRARERAHDDGQIEVWCARANGVAHGPYTRTAGAIEVARGSFDEGRADGAWAFVDPDGGTRVATFVRGVAHGVFSARAPDGALVYERRYAAGAPCGTWLEAGAEARDLGPCDREVTAGAPIGLPAPTVSSRGWDGASCPAGAEPRTSNDDNGVARWCVKAGGETPHGPHGAWLASGAKTVDGAWDEGLRTGLWRGFHADGGLAWQGAYAAGREDGAWSSWRADGSPEVITTWVDGAREGEAATWWAAGRLRTSGAWSGDRPDGVHHELDPDGVVRAEVTWRGGVRAGPASYHHAATGIRAARGEHAGGEREGVWTLFHDDGAEAARGPYTRGRAHGAWQEWDRAGRPTRAGDYAHGAQVGVWRLWTYQPEVTIVADATFAGGVLHGPYVERYGEDGPERAAGTFVDGRLEGPYTEWYPDGAIMAELAYVGGGLHGVQARFYADGAQATEHHYDLGVRHGPWLAWWPDGDPETEGAHERGRRVGTWRFWDEAGVETTITYDAGGHP